MISSSITPHLASYSKGLLDTSSVFVQSCKWCNHVIMEWQSHNWDLQLKIAELISRWILGHFRAFQEKKIGVGPRGYSWGTITRGYVVLGKYEKYFNMPTLALIPQNWGLKKSGKKTFFVREKTNLPPTTFFCILKNIRHEIINFGSAVCSQIFDFCISYANLFFPARYVKEGKSRFSAPFHTIVLIKDVNIDINVSVWR